MNRKLTAIVETAKELRARLKSEENPQLIPRLQAVFLIASSQVAHRTELADLLGVHRNSISNWLQSYEKGGLTELLKIKKAQGKPPKMTLEAKADLAARLADEKGFGSYGEIKTYLSEKHQVELSYSRVHTMVRYEMKAKPKVPRPTNPNKKKS